MEEEEEEIESIDLDRNLEDHQAANEVMYTDNKRIRQWDMVVSSKEASFRAETGTDESATSRTAESKQQYAFGKGSRDFRTPPGEEANKASLSENRSSSVKGYSYGGPKATRHRAGSLVDITWIEKHDANFYGLLSIDGKHEGKEDRIELSETETGTYKPQGMKTAQARKTMISTQKGALKL